MDSQEVAQGQIKNGLNPDSRSTSRSERFVIDYCSENVRELKQTFPHTGQ